jgi:uncharacterized protein (UPF0548 family)
VFQLKAFTAAAADQLIAAAQFKSALKPRFLTVDGRFKNERVPGGFAYDLTQSRIGSGKAAFHQARLAFRHWVPFDLGWTQVRNPSTSIELQGIVGVEVHSLGLWSLNLSRIVDMVDSPTRFGFVYATTEQHVEEGEERFLIELRPETGDVLYTLEAVSRPHAFLAQLGYPIARRFQRRFARESHTRMRALCSGH